MSIIHVNDSMVFDEMRALRIFFIAQLLGLLSVQSEMASFAHLHLPFAKIAYHVHDFGQRKVQY